MRANLDGTSAEVLLQMSLSANWMAVDNRYIYLAYIGGTISRANLDGTGYIEGSSSHTSSASAWRSTSSTSTG